MHLFVSIINIKSKYLKKVTHPHAKERIDQSKRDILAVYVISNDLLIVVALQLTFLHLLGWTIWFAYGTYGAEIRRKHAC